MKENEQNVMVTWKEHTMTEWKDNNEPEIFKYLFGHVVKFRTSRTDGFHLQFVWGTRPDRKQWFGHKWYFKGMEPGHLV